MRCAVFFWAAMEVAPYDRALDDEIGMDQRRTIRYLERLQRSSQYRGAIDAAHARMAPALS